MLALAAGLAAGCGGDDEPEGRPIPQQAAVDLESRLAEVERRMEAGGGACADIQNDTAPAVESILASLPSDVDQDVRDALQDSFNRLFDLTEAECDEEEGQATDTETEVAPPPETETDTETTETAPPPEEDEGDEEEPPATEVPTEEVPPETTPEDDGEAGQGNGGGALVPGEDG
jgi:hypothetical protein